MCWKAHQMLLDPASANEFRWVMDEDQILPPDGPRAIAERRCMEAVAAVDEARAPTEAERDEQMLHRGVTLATLRAVLAQVETPRMPTWQVVRDIVRPATRARRCRYVELLSDGVGRARVFVSHTWGAPFEDLVAAVAHALNGDETVPVWVDILAVRQWPGNVADLAF